MVDAPVYRSDYGGLRRSHRKYDGSSRIDADIRQINSFFGQSSFLHRFGTLDPTTGQYYVPANWQSAVNNAASIGQVSCFPAGWRVELTRPQVIGLLINGYCQSRFGAKRTYLCAMVLMAAAIFLPVFSTSLKMLFAAELVCGIPWGIFREPDSSEVSRDSTDYQKH